MLKEKTVRCKHPIGKTTFEAFYKGAWHGIDHLSIKNGQIFIQSNYHGPEDTISGDCIRLRSRKASTFDCIHLLKPGVDICVLSAHPLSKGSDQGPQVPVISWHDAKIMSIKRAHYKRQCACLFYVLFYRDNDPTSKIRNIADRMVEVVTIDNISILQKLHLNLCEDGFHHWTSSEDCISHGKSKLLSGTVSSEVSWLIVLSALKGMSFIMKCVENRIVYHILNNNRWSSSIADINSDCDSHALSSNSDENVKVLHFQICNEFLRPKIDTLAAMVLTGRTEPVPTMEVDPVDCTGDSESDIEILYDQINLRRSKRQKVQPDRFVSYFSRSSNLHSTKKMAIDLERMEQSTAMRSSSPLEGEPCQDKLNKCTSSKHEKSCRTTSVLERENLSPGKTKDSPSQDPFIINLEELEGIHQAVIDAEEISANSERNSQGGSKFKRPLKSVHNGGIFPSSHKTNHFPSGSYQKSYSHRKKLLSPTECKKMIEKLVRDIKSEMEGQIPPPVDCEIKQRNVFPERLQEFNWSPLSDTQIDDEEEEHEDLWKEMEHSLTTIALLEQKQKLDTELFTGANIPDKDGKQPCQHFCKLNEQIGVTCQLCNFVLTEIRYLSPPFLKNDSSIYMEKFGKEGNRWMGAIDLESDPFGTDISPSEMPLAGGSCGWTSIPDLKLKLHFHQKKAFEFIWRNIAGSLKTQEVKNPTENTGGCVISHSPGSGKTLLVISFLVSYLALLPKSRPLILAPKTAVHVWNQEFKKWEFSLPVHLIHPLESYKKEMWDSKTRISSGDFRRPGRRMMHILDCLEKLRLWHENPSVLLMSYPSFYSLAHKGRNMEYRRFIAGLLQGSPRLLILDEGHNPRSTKSKLRKFLMKVDTEYRILLSGTLFQNNFAEYFNTLCLARPRFIDDVLTELDPQMVNILSGRKQKKSEKVSRKEKLARRLFVEEIGQRINSSVEGDRKQGFDLLNRITGEFVDTYDGEKLDTLPGLQIYTLLLTSPDMQREVLTKLQKSIKQKRCPLELELLITVGSIHPWLITTISCVNDYFSAGELDNINKSKSDFSCGSKVKFVIDLVHKSTVKKERVLIFCHNIAPINFFAELFEDTFGWRRGEEVLVLQGDQELSVRAKVIEKFNGDTKYKCKVLLASTAACAEGISLTAASRVVLLDSEWNHSKTRQAIARAFRPGQEKVVYVYRLLASGTWEEDKYRSNEWKAWLSKMIFIGKYIEFSSSRAVEHVEDEMLNEMAEEDQKKTFQMIMRPE